jgi:hypothetical protein
MKRVYARPNIEVHRFESEDIMTSSGVTPIKNGGSNGTAQSGSYADLFGTN